MLGLLDILIKYKSIQLPPEALFQIASIIKPRYYTIASSNLKYPNEVKIAISLTEDVIFEPPNKRTRLGLTSEFIKRVADKNLDFTEHKVKHRIFIKDSNFRLPEDQTVTPIIMVGPGTGVVPFIGFM